MANLGGASSISVTVRVRPFTIREAAQLTKCDDGPLFLGDGSLAAVPTPKLMQKGIRPVIKVVDDKCLVFDPPEDNPVQRFSRSVVPNAGKRVKDQTFGFDRVFDENTTQGDVYEATTRNLLDSVMDGYNATVFAYGATGCGKTHTITGTAQQPGIIFLTMQELFERISDRSDDKTTEVSLSYLEIYNETIRDLLVPGGGKAGLMLREDANQAVSVAGLSSHHPQNVQEVMDMIMKGNELRTMSPTEANATSSRSHAVLQINVSQKDRNADVHEPHTMATLSIIDLAGSERASATKNRGDRLLEGANINKSLLALGSCINALCDPRKKNHVPYRNSKLTRLLKFSLGGNCKTVMIVCVSPSSQHFDETQNTLRYANRAKNIQTKVTRNVYNVNRHVKDFLKKIDEQMALINELKQQQKDHEGAAFVKFRKQSEKREAIAREGIARIRNAYEHSASERQEKVGNMKKLRQIERRIGMISSWIAAFDGICDARDEEEAPKNLAAMRKTAQGILIELEGSRQHYHQRLAKTNWERSIDSALQNGIRQLTEIDGCTERSDVASLTREAELLKSMAEREAHSSVLEAERGGDMAVVQALLSAHFETIASLNEILAMDEAGAVEAARKVLMRILQACSDATSQVIKPDGGLVSSEAFPPSKAGTPKRRKQANLLGPSPMHKVPMPMGLTTAPHLTASPMRASPKRRKAAAGVGRKGVSFTPNKKSPRKRAVRWRDDMEGKGPLTEFEKTPQKVDSSTPEVSSIEVAAPLPTVMEHVIRPDPSSDTTDSSPIGPPPELSLDLGSRPKSSRFQAGFLSKRAETGQANGSPAPPSFRNLSSSETDDSSPLRDLEPSKANRSSLHIVHSISRDDERSSSPSDANLDKWRPDATEALRVKSAVMKRASMNPATTTYGSATRPQRRRSPTGSSSASPTGGESGAGLFTAGQARRMVKSDKENASFHPGGSVLSPRTSMASVTKPTPVGRRTTIGEGNQRASGGGRERDLGRLSVVMGSGGGARGREREGGSMMTGGKGVWR
ncbi:MAG: kinesin-like protein Klp5 [Caeruleum heppii]|nr:MAG: kinesin-like protein Klp5 [Caeruleum heppii]